MMLPKLEAVVRWAEDAISKLNDEYGSLPGVVGGDSDVDAQRAVILLRILPIMDAEAGLERAADALARVLAGDERTSHTEVERIRGV